MNGRTEEIAEASADWFAEHSVDFQADMTELHHWMMLAITPQDT
jgi:hypothetical protein